MLPKNFPKKNYDKNVTVDGDTHFRNYLENTQIVLLKHYHQYGGIRLHVSAKTGCFCFSSELLWHYCRMLWIKGLACAQMVNLF